jgi:ParB-like chromosome segregation protein Spo0J
VSTPDTTSTRVLSLDDIVPYWRNPRVVTDDAVNAVAESIERYGYTQPIVVDAENVIVIGHTRYAALRRLGATEAPVMTVTTLSPTQVKQLRVIDNKAHELTS